MGKNGVCASVCTYLELKTDIRLRGRREVKEITTVRESVICESPPLISQKHRISNDTVGKAQADVTEIPYSSLVKNHILQKVLETTIG